MVSARRGHAGGGDRQYIGDRRRRGVCAGVQCAARTWGDDARSVARDRGVDGDPEFWHDGRRSALDRAAAGPARGIGDGGPGAAARLCAGHRGGACFVAAGDVGDAAVDHG